MVKTIVLADDDPTFLGMLTRFLEKDGFVVFPAKNGVEAVRITTLELPDLVLLDVDMPEMDGLSTLLLLRASPDTSSIPIVMLTGCMAGGHVLEALKRGAQDFIAKTLDIETLMLRIHINVSGANEIRGDDSTSGSP